MGQSRASIQHVYKAVKVSGIPMYGYHPRQHTFVKIFFYNPFMVKRAAEMLQERIIIVITVILFLIVGRSRPEQDTAAS